MSKSSNNKSKTCKLNKNLILASTTLAKTRQETVDAFLGHVTHLHLQGKRLRVIENLDICVALKVLYLYDNKIEEIENLDFAKNLAYLYLENNLISNMCTFTNSKLKKLYLDENQIQLVCGLEHLPNLEVLSVSRQRLPPNEILKFDISTLNSISNSLEVLDISGNNLSVLQPFTKLYNLRKLFCSDNKITNVAEIECVVCLPELVEVNFKRNPVCSLRKYRDYVIGAACDNLREFDDTAITLKNIEAIRGVQALRRRTGLNERTDSVIRSASHDSQFSDGNMENIASDDQEERSHGSMEDIEGQGDFQIAQF